MGHAAWNKSYDDDDDDMAVSGLQHQHDRSLPQIESVW